MYKLKAFNVKAPDVAHKLADFMSLRVAQYWKLHMELIEERCQQGNNFFIECEV